MMTIRLHKHVNYGFTIVELLIVIVVIGVLAAITIVAYNGITVRAANISRMAELRQWEKIIVQYHVLNGSYPVPSTGYGNYCLGTGFPNQAEVNLKAGVSDKATSNNPEGYCRDLSWAATRHEVSAEINTMLRTIGSLPGAENHKKLVAWGASVGPYYTYQANDHYLTGVFAGATCPEGTTEGWHYGTEGTMCKLDLPN